MTKPVRLQLSRKKGSNLQELSRQTNGLPAINCARPHRDGNPYRVGHGGIQSKAEAVAAHRAEMERAQREDPQAVALMVKRLHGSNLACWCGKGEPCHVDTLLELANQ